MGRAPRVRKVAHQALITLPGELQGRSKTVLPGQFPGSSKNPELQGPARPRAMAASGRYLHARGVYFLVLGS